MKRRANTMPKRIRITPEGLAAIQRWADAHDVSFSAAIESLARLGLGEAPERALAPLLASTVRRALTQHYDRIIRLLLYSIIESGTAARLAGATLYRLRPADTPLTEWNDRYRGIKEHAQMDARRALARPHIRALIEELYGAGKSELPDPDAGGDDGEDGEGGE